MRISIWTLTAALLLAEANLAASSALLHMPSMRRQNNRNEMMARSLINHESDLERRSPQSLSNGGDLTLASPDVESNNSTLQACTTNLQNLTTVTNEAGFAACYNILDFHENMGGMFQADLRLFQISPATDEFANVSMDAIGVQLSYPNSTQYSVLMNSKRTKRSLSTRQSSPVQIQQFSIVGNLKMQLDLKKLNTTELISLFIPQIQLSAASTNGSSTTSDITSIDTAYFVVGQFQGQATPEVAAEASNPLMAQEAITASKGFVLPGTSLGIFPTGLIVTSAWTFLFFLAFGLGTWGRIRHRDMYRKRIAVTAGRTGKR